MREDNERRCDVPGCGRAHKSRGYCATHYAQWFRNAPIRAEIRMRDSSPPLECTEPGCSHPPQGRGLCQMHYMRFLRHGHTKDTDCTRERKTCGIEGCDNHFYAKGMCHLHYMRKRKLAEKFDMTPAQFDEMLAAQGGGCAICKGVTTRTNWRSGKPDALVVDHDHETGATRGVLCSACNRAIGMLGDDPARLRAAADYLDRHASRADSIAIILGAAKPPDRLN